MDEQPDQFSDAECLKIFADLFPQGPAGTDVLAELAPQGWENSELVAVAHPSAQRRYEEALRIHENIQHLVSIKKKQPNAPESEKPPPSPPTLEEVLRNHKDHPIDAAAECMDLVARCLWDVFSDNHDVIAPDGRTVDIGSFRGAAGFLAEWLNALTDTQQLDYMDFYMGTIWVSGRADLLPVYRMIFSRLKSLGCEWTFSYPRLGVVRFSAPPEAGQMPYDPSAAFEKQQQEEQKQKEFEDLQASLREGYNQSVREARKLPPPETVKAYMHVYGRAPKRLAPAGRSRVMISQCSRYRHAAYASPVPAVPP